MKSDHVQSIMWWDLGGGEEMLSSVGCGKPAS